MLSEQFFFKNVSKFQGHTESESAKICYFVLVQLPHNKNKDQILDSNSIMLAAILFV